ncbi:MAG TPA: transporter [Chitinophagaceae bacterium]
MTSHSVSTGFLRTFAIGNKLARVQLGIPFTHLSGNAQINGHDTSGARTGFGDTRLRFSVNLAGAPAYDRKSFTSYTQKTVFGVSLVTTIPTGVYHKDKRINIGTNRWGLKPEVGISKRINRIYAEAYAGVWFYTENNQYLNTKRLTQDPVFSLQAHACYYFKNQMWLSINTTWFNGGTTKVDEVRAGDLLDNWRVGGTWSFPLGKGHSIKLQYHVGAFTATGYDYNAGIISYQYVFF